MADTTDKKSILKGKRRKKPSGPRRRFRLFLLVLVLVLAVVLAAAYRDGTGLDVLRRRLSYGRAETGQIRYSYDFSAKNRFAALGSRLAVLSDVSLSLLDDNGGEIWSAPVNMSAPAMAHGGGKAAAYDAGGTELYVLDESGPVLHLTSEDGSAFLSATLNRKGMLAVTAEQPGKKGSVSVYGPDMTLLFGLTASQRFVVDAYVTDDGQYLAAVTLGQEEGVFVSNIVLYDITQEDPTGNYSIAGGLVLSAGQLEDNLVMVADTCLTCASSGGEIAGTYSYGGAFLRDYDLGGGGFAVLLLNRYQSGNVGRLVTVDDSGQELGSLDIREEIRDISAAGRYLAVLYTDSLVVYNDDLQVYASLRGVDATSGVLMREDGTALLLSGDSARLFLP